MRAAEVIDAFDRLGGASALAAHVPSPGALLAAGTLRRLGGTSRLVPLSPASGVQPMVGYPGWVAAVGAGLLAVAVGVVVFVWWWTRPAQPRFATRTVAEPTGALGWSGWDEPLPEAQARYLAHVADVSRRYEAGLVGARAVHLELACAVRGYASARLGRDVRNLTVAELRSLTGDNPAAAALYAYLGPSFDGPTARPETTRASISAAWRVIQGW